VWHAALRPSDDASPADWLAPRLTGAIGTVTGTVPAGYVAYARILHPSARDDRWFTWAEVAKTTGRQPHALMQSHLPQRDYLLFEGSLEAVASSLAASVRTGSWPRDELRV
jgi:hypothetical protein